MTNAPTTNDAETQQEPDVHPIDFSDAEDWASGFVNAAINMHATELLPEAGTTLFRSIAPMFEVAPGTVSARLAYCLTLDALASSPEALKVIAQRLRTRLIETDPRLQVLYGGNHAE